MYVRPEQMYVFNGIASLIASVTFQSRNYFIATQNKKLINKNVYFLWFALYTDYRTPIELNLKCSCFLRAIQNRAAYNN